MFYSKAKGILSAHNGINIYRGCTHGCIYCDSRSTCYQINHPFEDVEVKENGPELLDLALSKKRNKVMVGTGSMCDPYCAIEKEIKYTRKCLEIIEKHHCGVTIITKSDLILRDLDILERINKTAKTVVQMTLTTYDEDLCKILEPHVCTTKARFEALKVFRDHHIPTVVWLCPFLPFINDTEENLRGLVNYLIEAKVYGIIFWGVGVTLREGDREYFYEQLDKHFPGLKQKYIDTYGNAYEVRSPKSKQLTKMVIDLCKQAGIETDTNRVFAYLSTLPKQFEQMDLFDSSSNG